MLLIATAALAALATVPAATGFQPAPTLALRRTPRYAAAAPDVDRRSVLARIAFAAGAGAVGAARPALAEFEPNPFAEVSRGEGPRDTAGLKAAAASGGADGEVTYDEFLVYLRKQQVRSVEFQGIDAEACDATLADGRTVNVGAGYPPRPGTQGSTTFNSQLVVSKVRDSGVPYTIKNAFDLSKYNSKAKSVKTKRSDGEPAGAGASVPIV